MICEDGWYKLYKIAFRNKLDLLSKKLSNDVFYNLIKSNESRGKFQYVVDSIKELELSDYNIKEIIFVIDLFAISFSITGHYLPDQKSIIINMAISPKMLLKAYQDSLKSEILSENFESLKQEVKYAIRHELEHAYYDKINDYSEPNYREQYGFNSNLEYAMSAKDYLLDLSEIDSYIRELMLKAKNKRIPIDNLLVDMVNKKITEIAPDTMKKEIEEKTEDGIRYKEIIEEILLAYRSRIASIYNLEK